MKNRKRTYLFNTKVDSFLFAVLYLAVLSITTFHHHPIDLLGVKNSVAETSNQESKHAYTAEQCPIINFSKTGFNSLSLDISIEYNPFKESIDYNSLFGKPHYQNFISYFSRRGPPSFKVV